VAAVAVLLVLVFAGFTLWLVLRRSPDDLAKQYHGHLKSSLAEGSEDDMVRTYGLLIIGAPETTSSSYAATSWTIQCEAYLTQEKRLGLPVGKKLMVGLEKFAEDVGRSQGGSSREVRKKIGGIAHAQVIVSRLREEIQGTGT
jgi:hypothetical protein